MVQLRCCLALIGPVFQAFLSQFFQFTCPAADRRASWLGQDQFHGLLHPGSRPLSPLLGTTQLFLVQALTVTIRVITFLQHHNAPENEIITQFLLPGTHTPLCKCIQSFSRIMTPTRRGAGFHKSNESRYSPFLQSCLPQLCL